MSIKMNKKIKVIVGDFNFKDGPHDVFDKNIILLLNEVSKEILSSGKCKKFPDLVSFGFWCRASNIRAIFNNYSFLKIEWGVALYYT